MPCNNLNHAIAILIMNNKSLLQLCFTIFILGLLACNEAGQDTNDATGQDPSSGPQTENPTDRYGGLALYTLRDTLAKRPKEVLKRVADIGYRYIEAAGYSDGKFYGMTPAEFKAYLDEVGLVPVSSHHGDVSLDNADKMIAAVKEVGFKYFVIPIPPMGHFKVDPATNKLGMSEEVEEIMKIINTIAQKCTAAGLECLYHNHDMEFEKNSKGIVPMDYFIERSDPQHLNFQMDLYWAARANADPIAYFNKAPGRFKSWHVKDMDEQGRFAPVGEGSIDFGHILEHKEQSGMEYYFVEQDMTFGKTPMEAVEISHQALKRFGFD